MKYGTLMLFLLLVSCSQNRTTKDLQQLFGKQVVLPENGRWRVLNRDTTVVPDREIPKIMVYYNSQGCTSCRLKELMMWSSLIVEIQSMPVSDTSKVEFLFILASGEEIRSLTMTLQQYDFKTPVLLDTQKSFEMQNLLPEKEIFHYFLLDRDNKIQLVGSPINNPKMWALYKKRIVELNT